MTSRQIFTAATTVARPARARRRVPASRAGQSAWASTRWPARSRWPAASAAIAAFPRLRAGLQALLAFYFGALALINGAMHVPHFADAHDLTGVLAAVAGVVLLGLSARHHLAPPAPAPLGLPRRLPSRWRSSRSSTPCCRSASAITETHKFRGKIGPAPAGYREVAFRASDGVKLSGWYRPTRNGATVLVLHGGGGDRTGAYRPRPHARPPRLRRAAVGRPRPRPQRGHRRTPTAGAGTATWPARWPS